MIARNITTASPVATALGHARHRHLRVAVARPGPAITAGRRAPKGTVRTYAGGGHFDIYDGPEHEAVVADEVEFLRRHPFASG